MKAPRAGARRSETTWRALRFFNLYRLVVSGLFVVLVWTDNLPTSIGWVDGRLFSWSATVYFLLAVLAQFLVETRLPRFNLQVLATVLLDICAITLMTYASGGITSGFGMLLIVSIAGGSVITGGRLALLLAAMASLAVLGEELYSLAYEFSAANYTHAGFLGAAFFATSFLGYVLAERIRESEALADQQAIDLANLSTLNDHIVQRMQSGILVLDSGGRVRLVNAAGRRLLGLKTVRTDQPLNAVSRQLAEGYRGWLDDRTSREESFRPEATQADVLVSFTGLGENAKQGTLVFLEDAAVTRQRAQQLNLASLGRLTASIAHEIRNPLGAISHAGQLLEESPAVSEEDRRLTKIIREHTQRVNTVIENVLQIGRRERAVPESFVLRPWLDKFAEELVGRNALSDNDVTVNVDPEDITVRMDSGQLHQVLWNLCENALRYSQGTRLLEVTSGINVATERPYLDIRDHGSGISEDVQKHLFEPFFTTDPHGTGLGLFLASELCASNQASLSLFNTSSDGCTFRINFAHPDRQQLSK
jgi:two-component system sensor histidine kinase PilS (NtrC family)